MALISGLGKSNTTVLGQKTNYYFVLHFILEKRSYVVGSSVEESRRTYIHRVGKAVLWPTRLGARHVLLLSIKRSRKGHIIIQEFRHMNSLVHVK